MFTVGVRSVKAIRTGGAVLLLSFAIPLTFGGEPDIFVVGTWNGTTCDTGADVWGEGDYAYWGHFGLNCVDILDISTPSQPQWVGSYVVPAPDQEASAQDVKVHNGLAYVAYQSSGFNAAGIVDVRDPANPVQLTTLRPDIDGHVFTTSHNLFYHQGYLYLVDSGSRDIAIIDLTDYDPDDPPSHIASAKWLLTGVGSGFVHDITVLGDRLYASAWTDIVIFDITNIDTQAPSFLGSAPGDAAHASWATDDGRFVVVTEERSGGGLKLFGVDQEGDSLTITLLDEVVEPPPTFSAHNSIIVDDRVYTSWYGSGLIVHEIHRDGGRLVEIGRIDPGNTWGVYPLLGLDRVILGGFGNFIIVDATLCAPVTADWEDDGDVDFADFAAFQRCFSTTDSACLETFDADCNGLIDTHDFAAYLDAVTGP